MDKLTIIILGLAFIALCLCFYEVCYGYDAKMKRDIEALDREIAELEKKIRSKANDFKK
jgi:hypothetical protein